MKSFSYVLLIIACFAFDVTSLGLGLGTVLLIFDRKKD